MAGLLLIIVFVLYAYTGNKLGKNTLMWGLAGIGILITPQLILSFLLPFMAKTPEAGLLYWTIVCIASLLLTLGIAIKIIYKHKLFSSKRIV